MNVFVYSVLFIIFTPRLFFNLTKPRSANVTLKETIGYAAIFTFAVIAVQYISKRYGILEGFAVRATTAGATANKVTAAGATTAGATTAGATKLTDGKQLPAAPSACNYTSSTTLAKICAPICAQSQNSMLSGTATGGKPVVTQQTPQSQLQASPNLNIQSLQ